MKHRGTFFYFQVRLLTACLLVFYTHIAFSQQSLKQLTELRTQLAQNPSGTKEVDLLLKLSEYYLHKPGELTTDMDSAQLLLSQANSLNKELQYSKGTATALWLQGEIYHEQRQLEKARQMAERALSFSHKNKLAEQEADSYMSLASFYSISTEADLQRKITYYRQAVSLLESTQAKLKTAQSLQYLGDLYNVKDDYDSSLIYLHKSLKLFQESKHKEQQGIYSLLGYVYTQKGNYFLAFKYGLQAARISEDLHDTSPQMYTIYHRLAALYHLTHKDSVAYTYFSKAIKVAMTHRDTAAIIDIRFSQIFLLRKLHKSKESLAILLKLHKDYAPTDSTLLLNSCYAFANIYMDMKEYKKARLYTNKLLEYNKTTLNNVTINVYPFRTVTRLNFETKRFKDNYPYLKAYDQFLRYKFKDRGNLLADNELCWARTDSATGNYQSAFKHFQIYKEISDSIHSAENEKQLAALQLQYDLDNKEKDIQLLRKEGIIQNTAIQKEKVTKNIVIGGSVMLLLLLGLSYNRYRLKQHSNLQLQIKQAEINEQNELLKKLLSEKEWLLKEIHHRVKNNLQIVISLLNTQSAYLNNEDALQAIRNSQHRMYAMSLIHQKLYQSENMASIDMHWYIQELVLYMQECFSIHSKIHFILDTDSIQIDVVQAVPLGLIVNEAVTNTIKYAFPDQKRGEVRISLKTTSLSLCQLTIKDNGIGLPAGLDIENTESLGMSLMRGLTQQLGGTFQVNSQNGVALQITFEINRELGHGGEQPI
ncbi:histidine kinase dimerization/phosphoacceptor domain -containing protein [Cytophagaceae bacterium YF14B1]|uniref:histidine kinase n=1 Tax=Xanthocytophaga flava TaxID=3048013 RepID=A0AAE3QUI0_9BACT|nr:histidine kinase dimerization/phosphoacceptor domain -containing protein [Xanthocytophaga flavus]MDJ1483024.1 histidine kinase dimerization/phosphoacceptor domain -containing protein [Xanthocytophaga flavus]